MNNKSCLIRSRYITSCIHTKLPQRMLPPSGMHAPYHLRTTLKAVEMMLDKECGTSVMYIDTGGVHLVIKHRWCASGEKT